MKVARVLQTAFGDVAYAAGTAGVIAAAVGLFSLTAPRQMHDVCVSAREMAVGSGMHWSCGAGDASLPAAPAGQVIARP